MIFKNFSKLNVGIFLFFLLCVKYFFEPTIFFGIFSSQVKVKIFNIEIPTF